MIDLLRPLRRAPLLVTALLALGPAGPVGAQTSTQVPASAKPSTVGPSIAVDHTTISAGDPVVVTISGFTSSLVTISVCGNNATRGSADCNMTASEGVKLNSDGTSTLAQMSVATPPVPCPCVVRVSSQTYDEVAVATINLIGQPTAPVVGGPSPNDPLVAVSLSTRAKSQGAFGWIRSSLGGPVTYELTVTVKNLTNETLHHVALSGEVGRGSADTLVTLGLIDPGELGPGQTRQQIVSAKLPAPSMGTMSWRVASSGAGPTVIVTQVTRHRPVLLLVLLVILVVDIAAFITRRLIARRRARIAPGRHDRPRGVSEPSGEDEALGSEDSSRGRAVATTS